ncbi:hypothetical protein ABZV31_10625 [Streptomyces sp. NPDC005202]|uniref:hypothetical protein n=1 Tax=Streptomyces sp. NPDC005202 TaxID=3157021 RepID=UPI0033A653B5
MGNGGGQYWNEETQRWEDGPESAAPVTPPPPPRPGHAPHPPPGRIWDPDASPTVPSTDGAGGAWPPAAPPSGPLTVGGHSRRVVGSVIGGAAAVGVAVSLVVTLGFGVGQDDHKGAAPASSTPATAESSPTTYASEESTTDTPSPSAEPPAGYTTYDDPQGFRIAVPDGWQRSAVSSQYGMDIVNYRDSAGDRRLQVYEVAEASPDESFGLYLSSAVPKPPGFRKLSLANLDTADFTGSRLEYVADSLKGEPDIGTWHVVDERFQAADGKLYAIASYGPDADGSADEREVLDTALAWFCPPYTACAAPTG